MEGAPLAATLYMYKTGPNLTIPVGLGPGPSKVNPRTERIKTIVVSVGLYHKYWNKVEKAN